MGAGNQRWWKRPRYSLVEREPMLAAKVAETLARVRSERMTVRMVVVRMGVARWAWDADGREVE